MGEHTADATGDEKGLRTGRVSERLAAADVEAVVLIRRAQSFNGVGSRRLSSSACAERETKDDNVNGGFHMIFGKSLKLSGSCETGKSRDEIRHLVSA